MSASLLQRNQPRRVAVCLHVFYEDIALEIIEWLSRIDAQYALFITSVGQLPSTVREAATRLCRPLHVMEFPNLGRDIRPFLHILTHPEMQPYDIICKLHTKRDLAAEHGGSAWRDICMQCLIGSAERFDEIVRAFQSDSRLLLAGPKLLYKSVRSAMAPNGPNVEHIARSVLDTELASDWGFFAGTMFWARRSLFISLLDLERVCRYEPEDGAEDGHLTHAVERIIGLLPVRQGGKIGLVFGDYSLEVISAPGQPSKEPNRPLLARVQADILDDMSNW